MKTDPEIDALLTTAAVAGGVGLVFGVGRGVIEERHGTWRDFVAGVVAAVIVGVLLGWALKAARIDSLWGYAAIGVCGYVALDVLALLRMASALMRSDPLGVIGRFLEAFPGTGAVGRALLTIKGAGGTERGKEPQP